MGNKKKKGANMINLRSCLIVLVAVFGVDAFGQEFGIKRGEDLPLYYDVRSGNVTIDTTNVQGGVFVGYNLQIPFNGYILGSYTPFMETQFVTERPYQVAESNLSGMVAGVYSLGNILPSNLSPNELGDFFEPQRFNAFGSSGNFQYTVTGGPGSQTYYALEPNYAASPFPALNDPTVGPVDFRRWADEVTLTYHQDSGQLELDTSGENGGTIWSYQIQLWNSDFNLDEFLPVTDGTTLTADESRITEIGITGIPGGDYSLGNILPAGLSERDLSGLVRSAIFVGEPGRGTGALDLGINGKEMTVSLAVPEPIPHWPLMLAVMLIGLTRRRARLLS